MRKFFSILSICLINNFLIFFYLFISLTKIYNYFVFFSWARFVKWLYLFFTQKNFAVLTRSTFTNRRTKSFYFFTTTIVAWTVFWTITTIFINFLSINDYILFFKSSFINAFRFFDNKISSCLKFFFIQTIIALASRTTKSKLFKTGAVQS